METTGRTPRVGISGSYGGFNLGDEAILTVIVSELRRAGTVEVTVFFRDPEDTRRRHAVERAYRWGELSRGEAREVVAELDLFVLGGGGILHEGEADTFLREVFVAHEVGTPVMVYAVSVGPLLPGSPVRARIRDALNGAAAVTVRDRQSRQLLEDLGVEREIVVTADPALLLQPEPLTLDDILRAEAIDPSARLIGFSVREPGPAAPDLNVEHYHALLANAADFMVERLDAEIVFFPMERRGLDVQHSHGVAGRMSHAQRATVLKREYSPGQILSLLSHFEFTVGMRLHFLIFSVLAGLPFVPLPYATKVSAFLEDLGVRAPRFEHVTAGELIAHVDRAWDERRALCDRIEAALPALKARARRNHEIALDLLKRAREVG